MIGHTPGPWKFVATDDGHEIRMGTAYHGRNGWEPQHLIEYGHGSREDCHEQFLEGKANARLITAAPDLLAACVKFVDSFKSLQREKCDVAHRMACAAIAKAEGRS